jgi:hypothetical protein
MNALDSAKEYARCSGGQARCDGWDALTSRLNLRLVIDWSLRTDPARPNKHSKSIELCVSREAIDDYKGSTQQRRATADKALARHILARLKSFNPEHQTPREIVPPVNDGLSIRD